MPSVWNEPVWSVNSLEFSTTFALFSLATSLQIYFSLSFSSSGHIFRLWMISLLSSKILVTGVVIFFSVWRIFLKHLWNSPLSSFIHFAALFWTFPAFRNISVSLLLLSVDSKNCFWHSLFLKLNDSILSGF